MLVAPLRSGAPRAADSNGHSKRAREFSADTDVLRQERAAHVRSSLKAGYGSVVAKRLSRPPVSSRELVSLTLTWKRFPGCHDTRRAAASFDRCDSTLLVGISRENASPVEGWGRRELLPGGCRSAYPPHLRICLALLIPLAR